MPRIPRTIAVRRICVICEGQEEEEYFRRLLSFRLWESYAFHVVNAHGESNIPKRFHELLQTGAYPAVLILCDTDRLPFVEYRKMLEGLSSILGSEKTARRHVIYSNPCTMQIVLLHFGDTPACLSTQSKRVNAKTIEALTGVRGYKGCSGQIREICRKIHRRSYDLMKRRVLAISFPDTTPGSTNFGIFLERFESSDSSWIDRP